MKKYPLLFTVFLFILLSCKKEQQAPAGENLAAASQPLPAVEALVPPNFIQTAYYWCEPWPQLTYKPTYSWWVANFSRHDVYLKHASAGGNWVLAGYSVRQVNGTFIFNKLIASGTWWMYFTNIGGPAPNNSYTHASCNCVKSFNVSCGPPPGTGD